jgi:hypothetical protein
MGEVTLTVPAEYVEFFKLGVLNEIETDCGSLIENAREMAGKPGWSDADVQGTGRFVSSALVLLAQLQEAKAGEDVRVVEPQDDGILEHALAAAARNVAGPRLQNQLRYGPVDREEADKIEALTRALSWAVEMSAQSLELREAKAEVA